MQEREKERILSVRTFARKELYYRHLWERKCYLQCLKNIKFGNPKENAQDWNDK